MKCPNCTAEMRLDPASGKLVCDYCLTEIDPKALQLKKTRKKTKSDSKEDTSTQKVNTAVNETEESTRDSQEESLGTPKETDAGAHKMEMDGMEMTVYTCASCGAELLATEDTAVTFCSYCNSQNILKGRIEQVRKPDRIIPFSQSKEECEKAYRKTLRKALFAPGNMAKTQTIEKFRGIYMPFWVYSLKQSGKVESRGKISYRRGDYIITDHYALNADCRSEYKAIAYDASANFADNISQGVAPFDNKGSSEFDSTYMAGFYADVADVPEEAYYGEAKSLAAEDLSDKLYNYNEYKKYSVSRTDIRQNIEMNVDRAEMAYFPVWFLGTKSADGKRISYAAVNGQTGKVAAETPIAFWKYLLGSIVLAIPIFFILNLFLTLTPTKSLIAAIILSIISLIIINGSLNRVYTKENKLDDVGLKSKGDAADANEKSGDKNNSRNKGENKKNSKDNSKNNSKDKSKSKSKSKTKNKGKKGKTFGFGDVWILAVMVIIVSILVASSMVFTKGGMIFILVMVIIGIASFVSEKTTTHKTGVVASMPFSTKRKYFAKPVISLVLSVLVLAFQPVHDYWYYASTIIAFALIALTFKDIIKEHNLLTTRKLPQLEARGGDENA